MARASYVASGHGRHRASVSTLGTRKVTSFMSGSAGSVTRMDSARLRSAELMLHAICQ